MSDGWNTVRLLIMLVFVITYIYIYIWKCFPLYVCIYPPSSQLTTGDDLFEAFIIHNNLHIIYSMYLPTCIKYTLKALNPPTTVKFFSRILIKMKFESVPHMNVLRICLLCASMGGVLIHHTVQRFSIFSHLNPYI